MYKKRDFNIFYKLSIEISNISRATMYSLKMGVFLDRMYVMPELFEQILSEISSAPKQHKIYVF